MHAKIGLGAIRSTDYVIILCDDLERMKTFHRDVLGFEIDGEAAETCVEFRVGMERRRMISLHMHQ